MVSRVICAGSRLDPRDDVGPRVYDLLSARPLPPGLELVDGGLSGLDLLPFVEGAERVVFVDAAFDGPPDLPFSVISGARVAAIADRRYGHAAGLPYLLRVLPHVCEGLAPEVFVVGVSPGASEDAVAEAGRVAVRLAAGVEAVT
jgi:hydrogenase maturation protease